MIEKTLLALKRANLSQAIREAKQTSKERIHSHILNIEDTRHMYQDSQAIRDYNSPYFSVMVMPHFQMH